MFPTQVSQLNYSVSHRFQRKQLNIDSFRRLIEIQSFFELKWSPMFHFFSSYCYIRWSDEMRCCRSDWPGLCLFCCYQPLCVISQQSWFWAFFLFHQFSNFTPPPQEIVPNFITQFSHLSSWPCNWHSEENRAQCPSRHCGWWWRRCSLYQIARAPCGSGKTVKYRYLSKIYWEI